MEQNLSIACRPKTLDDMVGADKIVDQIRKQMASGRIPKAWLFSGQPGSGKTTIAEIIAWSLQCNHTKVFGSTCALCLQKYEDNEFSILSINVPDNNGVNEARDMVSKAMNFALNGPHRIVILDEVHKMTEPAQTILLTSLESEDSNTIWILSTSAPGKIIEPLRRRCLSFVMPSTTEESLKTLIDSINAKLTKAKQPTLKDKPAKELISALQANGITSPGLAVMAIEKCLAGASPEEAAQVTDVTSVNMTQLWNSVSTGDWAKASGILIKATPEDGRGIRSTLASRFKYLLLKSDGNRAGICARAIHELASYPSFEDGLNMSSTVASVYKICVMIKEAPNGRSTEKV